MELPPKNPKIEYHPYYQVPQPAGLTQADIERRNTIIENLTLWMEDEPKQEHKIQAYSLIMEAYDTSQRTGENIEVILLGLSLKHPPPATPGVFFKCDDSFHN